MQKINSTLFAANRQGSETQGRKTTVDKMDIRDLMTPIDQFSRISHKTTFYEAVLALEKSQEEFLSGRGKQRILLVENERNEVVGKLTPMDLLRGLEPNYNKIEGSEMISRFGLGYVVESMKDEMRLWQKPLADLCTKAQDLKVGDIVKLPIPGRTISVNDSMDEALHRFVVGGHESLFVTEKGQIIGLLRFSDVYKAISEAMKACRSPSGDS